MKSPISVEGHIEYGHTLKFGVRACRRGWYCSPAVFATQPLSSKSPCCNFDKRQQRSPHVLYITKSVCSRNMLVVVE
jgi:hypothetical protein